MSVPSVVDGLGVSRHGDITERRVDDYDGAL